MRFLTAGESHGKALLGILEGMPSGLLLDLKKIEKELIRRRSFYGRSNRMKLEADELEILSGLRGGRTYGAPIAFSIKNHDYRPQVFETENDIDAITKPRPGHADYAGMVKYGLSDARLIAERASGRETATRTVIGAIARQLLSALDIHICSHVKSIGGIKSIKSYYTNDGQRAEHFDDLAAFNTLADSDVLRCIDNNTSKKMVQLIDKARENGDTLGGEVEILVRGMPCGFGSFMHHEHRLDGKIAATLMSIPSVKGVIIGNPQVFHSFGSEISDPIIKTEGKIDRQNNNGGGIEGGMTNGADIVIALSIKPVPTMAKGAATIDVLSGESAIAHYERSDICVVPTISVIAENLLGYLLADTILTELGDAPMSQLINRFNARQL